MCCIEAQTGKLDFSNPSHWPVVHSPVVHASHAIRCIFGAEKIPRLNQVCFPVPDAVSLAAEVQDRP
jgi:hypothetical protein